MELNTFETRMGLDEASKVIFACGMLDPEKRMEIALDLRQMSIQLISGIRTHEQMQDSLLLAVQCFRKMAQEDGPMKKLLLQLADDTEHAGLEHDFMYCGASMKEVGE